MKKKLFNILFLLVSILLLPSCTIHFKSKELELDAKPPEAKIGNTTERNTTYYMTDADLL